MLKLAAFFVPLAFGNMISALPTPDAGMIADDVIDQYSEAGQF